VHSVSFCILGDLAFLEIVHSGSFGIHGYLHSGSFAFGEICILVDFAFW